MMRPKRRIVTSASGAAAEEAAPNKAADATGNMIIVVQFLELEVGACDVQELINFQNDELTNEELIKLDKI